MTQRGSNKQVVFFDATDYRTYLRLVRDNQKSCGINVLAYCLMPNHVHLVVRPDFDDSLRDFIQRTHGQFSRYINIKEGRTGHLWHNGYFACPLSESHLLRALRYVEYNPVRAGLAPKPEKFQWCSAAIHLGAPDTAQIVDLEFWRSQGGVDTWRNLLATPEQQIEERRLRACTFAGRPFGDDKFLERQDQISGKKWQRKGFEKKLATEAAA